MFGAAIIAACAGTLLAQKTTQVHPGTGGSPHVKSEWTIDGASIAIEYGRPFLKGRTDAQVMPPGQPWRAGADEATTITSNRALKFGSQTLAAGTYTINMQPGTPWQLIVGKLGEPKQWGVAYKPELEMWRVPMTAGKAAAAVEQVTISIDDTPAGAALRLEWGMTSVTVPFTVG
jgi:hypothetical protein